MLLFVMYKAPEVFQCEFLLFHITFSNFTVFLFPSTAFSLPEKEVISTTITFLRLQNANDLNVLSKTDQFIYTMITFLGKEDAFLDTDVKNLLTDFVHTTFQSQEQLDFDVDFDGRFNFENLYITFLDQFQGSSYGDHTFGQLVITPLAQKHNIKWRQIIWSEHVHVLRFVTCTESEVKYEMFIL